LIFSKFYSALIYFVLTLILFFFFLNRQGGGVRSYDQPSNMDLILISADSTPFGDLQNNQCIDGKRVGSAQNLSSSQLFKAKTPRYVLGLVESTGSGRSNENQGQQQQKRITVNAVEWAAFKELLQQGTHITTASSRTSSHSSSLAPKM
jgi:hypothetical protein